MFAWSTFGPGTDRCGETATGVRRRRSLVGPRARRSQFRAHPLRTAAATGRPWKRHPNSKRRRENEDVAITEREYGENDVDGEGGTEQLIAVDFGPVGGEVTLDVVDETAIVVVNSVERSRLRDGTAVSRDDENRQDRFSNHSADRSGGDEPPEDDEQYEFDVPADASEVTVNDGIVTIRG